MFDTWTTAQKKAAKKLFLWWAFRDSIPDGYQAITNMIALFNYMSVIWEEASDLDPLRTSYPNETFVWDAWKLEVDDATFFGAVYQQLLMD